MKITDQIQTLHGERLQPYNLEIAKDGARAMKLVTEFESTIHTPAMVPCFFFPFLLFSSTNIPSSDSSNFQHLSPRWPLCLQALVRCAEDVIHTLEEMLPFDGQPADPCILELERLKEKLHSAVHFILQTLRTVARYHHSHKKAGTSLPRW